MVSPGTTLPSLTTGLLTGVPQNRRHTCGALRIGVPDCTRVLLRTDNAFIESFNARVRLECLNQHWFLDLDDARAKIELWRRHYNDVRPHSAIGERTPMTVYTAHRNGPIGLTAPKALV